MGSSATVSLEIEALDSIEGQRAPAWDELAPKDQVGLERGQLLAAERARLNELEPWYLVARAAGEPVGIGHFFLLDMDFSRLGSELKPHTRQALKSWFPGFLELRVAECGFLTALGEGIAARGSWLPATVRAVALELERIARDRGGQVAIVRDVPFEARASYRALEELGWVSVLGFPRAGMALNQGSFEEYLRALKYKKSLQLRNTMKKLAEGGLTVRTIQRFGAHAERLEALWQQVHERASDYEHELLTAAWFREVDRCLPERTSLTALCKGEEILGFFLNFLGDDLQFSAHCGLDYARNQEHSIYFNLYLAALREAFERGYRRVDFGLTTYDFKFSIGCQPQPLVYFVKHLQRPELTRAFADILHRAIPQPENKRKPFRAPQAPAPDLPGASRALSSPPPDAPRDVFRRAQSYVRMDILRFLDLYTFCPPFDGAQLPVIEYQGRPVIMLGTNAYLGLDTHPDVRRAAAEAIERYGSACSGSPLLNGTPDLHQQLAAELAAFLGKDDALLFSTGYQTNLGVLSTVVNYNDVVLMDELNHASLVDGAQLSRALLLRYRHNDLGALEDALKREPKRAKLVAADGVFSMEGSLARLPGIVALAKRYGARIMVDEAHGIGTLGPGGRGVAEHFGLLDQVDLVLGTFSKSLAAVGGFVAGDAEVIDHLRHKARSHVFSASLPPAAVASVRQALAIIKAQPQLRRDLLDNARYLARALRDLGYQVRFQGAPIISLPCGDELLTLGLYRALLDQGVYVNPVLHPAVPKGREGIRNSVMATHTRSQLGRAAKFFAQVRTTNFPVKPSMEE